MNIGIDVSPLLGRTRTGVGEYTYEFLDALFQADKKNQYFLFYNSWRDENNVVLNWRQANVHVVRTRWPNKIFHASVQFLKWPKVDRMIVQKNKKAPARIATRSVAGGQKTLKAPISLDHLDYFFSPNLGFQALSKGCKHILTIHDLSFVLMPETFSWKRRIWHHILDPRQQCRRADMILVPSQNTKRDVVRVYGVEEKKIQVLYPGLSSLFVKSKSETDCNAVRRKYDLPEKFILFLGTIEPRKNIETLIEAFGVLQKNGGEDISSHQLIIAGPLGWKYKKILRQIQSAINVRSIGYVAPEDKYALYALSTMFVYPSLYEGFGFPVLEALFAGTPVIASYRASLPEVGGRAVQYVNPNNIQEIVQAITRVLSGENQNEGMISVRQVEKFSWQGSAGMFIDSMDRHDSM